jgi:pimeloyl-ACP methyl ester carboxylesterase
MKYFNGFLFQNEEELFCDCIPKGDTVVAGFSYGAIKAFEYALKSANRVDRLILLSPAFFEDKNESYIKKQLKYFENKSYKQSFFANVAYPSNQDLSCYYYPHTKEDLKKLLCYQWEREGLETLNKRGVVIEVFLGERDRIIDTDKAHELFSKFAVTYLLKNRGHSLQL